MRPSKPTSTGIFIRSWTASVSIIAALHQADDQRRVQVHRRELAENRPPGLEELRQEGAEEHQGLGGAGQHQQRAAPHGYAAERKQLRGEVAE